MTDETAAQHCVACGQVKLPSDYWTQKITYWQELAIANRKVAEDNQTKLAAVTKRKDECSNGWDEALAQRDKAVFALKGLLEDITEYQTINNLGGENNHWQVIARTVLKECGK